MDKKRLAALLESKYEQYNSPLFIESDPIRIPHRFSKKQDIEISALLTATIAWGNRKSIINSATKLLDMMDDSPHEFVTKHQDVDLKPLSTFVHRTFNGTDVLYFVEFLKHHYADHDTLESAFLRGKSLAQEQRLIDFHQYFFSLEFAPQRTKKHVSTPTKGSTCKRLNMFLRWMVRKDKKEVDFGLWSKIKPSDLLIPLDVHVDRTARKLGLIKRKQTDWQTVLELTENLRQFDAKDPVKYDYALFGISVLDKMELP